MNKRDGMLIVIVTILVLGLVGTASATNWSVDGSGDADFTGIQEAINNASDGDTIIVHSGVYYENVVVDKSVMLKGIDHPVVDAGGEGRAITLTADGITLVGFTATNSGSLWQDKDVGIKVISSNNTITGNNASNNNRGGIRLSDFSNNNNITGNNVCNNNQESIHLSTSCNNNTITGNNVCNNRKGIYLSSSSTNNITGNNVNNNHWDGIIVHDSSNNTFIGNNVSNNRKGIYLYDSCNNTIYFNNFINNTDNVYFYTSTTIWNSPLEMSYTYDGNAYTNYVGNYWGNYGGIDADGDGIGDTHYSIDSESDERDDYPLMKPFKNYNISASAYT